MKKKSALVVLFGVLTLGSCSLTPKPPAPAGMHWGSGLRVGDQLYCNVNGTEAASIIDGQACVFQGGGTGCNHFETNKQAIQDALRRASC